jgi:hypothetical protein
MSAEAPAGPEAIEIHFCRRCGISIPQGDIETHRARAVPGGFLCDACAIDAPVIRAATTAAAVPRSGSRALLFLALLYVVGASTFLLVRELRRTEPQALRADFATPRDLEALVRKVDAIDEQMRRAFADLKANDERQRDDARETSLRLNALSDLPRVLGETRNRVDDLDAMSKALATKTQLVRDEVEAARNELRQLRGESGISKPPPEAPAIDLPPVVPARSPEEAERDRLVSEYVATLANKKAANGVRYNAAVSLGELRHPTAIPALIEALENDPYDLVCRAAAWSLGMYGKDAIPAIPALIRQLGGKDGTVGYMCERALGDITKAATGTAVSFGFDSNATQRARKKVQKDWEEWWEKEKDVLLPGAG